MEVKAFFHDVISCVGELLRWSHDEQTLAVQALQSTETAMRSQVDHLQADWHGRVEMSESALMERTLQFNTQKVLAAESLQRCIMAEIAWKAIAVELWPRSVQLHLRAVQGGSQKELAQLRHALYVTQKESVLIKQKATVLVEMEVASCKTSVSRLHRRRMEDLNHLSWDPSLFGGQANSSPSKLSFGWRFGLQVVEDLESSGRALLARTAVESIHVLHMCLLIS
jgi:hypothetical protein